MVWVLGFVFRSFIVKGKIVEVVDVENGKRGEIFLLFIYMIEMEYIGGGVVFLCGGVVVLEMVLRCLMMYVMVLGSVWLI